MTSARTYEFDCVLIRKFDRFARSTRHLLTALEEFDYLGVRFISVQDQIDTASPMGRAMFTIIGAMAEFESSLISERVTVSIKAATARGKRLGRPPLAPHLIVEIETLAESTNLSIRKIMKKSKKGHVAVASARSRSGSGQNKKIPCDRFLHVSCTYPLMGFTPTPCAAQSHNTRLQHGLISSVPPWSYRCMSLYFSILVVRSTKAAARLAKSMR